jgi:hypothetical protein
MNRFLKMSISGLLLIILIFNIIPVTSIYANGRTITVTPNILIETMSSGTTQTFPVSVTSDFPVDIEIDGLGETKMGATEIVPPQNDTTPYSARSWISIDASHFEPVTNKILNVTVKVPSDTPAGERYAAIYLYGKPDSYSMSTSGILIPVIITVNADSFVSNPVGELNDLQIPNAYSGKAIDIFTTFNNTGNCRITGAVNKVTITDNAQNMKWQKETPVVAPSILPLYPRTIISTYNAGLTTGDYTVTSLITLATGSVYSKTLNFTVVEPPPLPVAPTLTQLGANTAPGPVTDTLTPSLQWTVLPQNYKIDYYELTISRAPYTSSDTVFISDPLTDTSFAIPPDLLFGGESYSWTLTATNVTGISRLPVRLLR